MIDCALVTMMDFPFHKMIDCTLAKMIVYTLVKMMDFPLVKMIDCPLVKMIDCIIVKMMNFTLVKIIDCTLAMMIECTLVKIIGVLAPGAWQVLRADAPGPRRSPASLRTHVRIPRQSPKRACTARKKTGRVFARDSDQLSEKASCSTANSYQNPTTLTKTGLYREKGRVCTRNRN